VIKVDTDGVPGITNDKTIMDLLNPIYFFGGSFNMSYKGFDLMFQGTGAMIFCSLSPTIKTYY
jgi:hypothetical protein